MILSTSSLKRETKNEAFSNCCKFFQWLHTWPSSGPKRRREKKKKIGVPRQRSKTGIHPRQWKRASPFFFSSFESCVTGSRSYQAFSWFFGPCSLASKENRGGISPFFQISGISECLRTKTVGNWFRLMYISLFCAGYATSQDMNFFPPL